jgi:hypothetical protein
LGKKHAFNPKKLSGHEHKQDEFHNQWCFQATHYIRNTWPVKEKYALDFGMALPWVTVRLNR